jgi:hypothetical protein
MCGFRWGLELGGALNNDVVGAREQYTRWVLKITDRLL